MDWRLGTSVVGDLGDSRTIIAIASETINTIKSVDGMKAVKVAFDLSQTNMDSITKVTEVVTLIDNNLKSLAIKVMELEKKLEELDDTVARRINNEPRKN